MWGSSTESDFVYQICWIPLSNIRSVSCDGASLRIISCTFLRSICVRPRLYIQTTVLIPIPLGQGLRKLHFQKPSSASSGSNGMQEINPNLGEEDHQKGPNDKSLRDIGFMFLLLWTDVASLITFVRYLRANTGE